MNPSRRQSKIERTFRLFHGPARYAMSIDHRRLYIAVAKQFLNRTDIVIGLEQVRCETVAECVG